MRRFVAGFALGLALAAVPAVGEWGWTDMDILKGIAKDVTRIATALEKIAVAEDSQQRATWQVSKVIANCPAEAPTGRRP